MKILCVIAILVIGLLYYCLLAGATNDRKQEDEEQIKYLNDWNDKRKKKVGK